MLPLEMGLHEAVGDPVQDMAKLKGILTNTGPIHYTVFRNLFRSYLISELDYIIVLGNGASKAK